MMLFSLDANGTPSCSHSPIAEQAFEENRSKPLAVTKCGSTPSTWRSPPRHHVPSLAPVSQAPSHEPAVAETLTLCRHNHHPLHR